MTAILKEEPLEPVAAVGSDASALVPVLRHCLEKKPEKRFQSARDLAFALETATPRTGARPARAEPPRLVSRREAAGHGGAVDRRGGRRVPRASRPRRVSRVGLERGDAHTADDGSGLRRRADVLPRRTDDRVRGRSRWKLRDLSAADLGRARAQPDRQSRRRTSSRPSPPTAARSRSSRIARASSEIMHAAPGLPHHRGRHLDHARPRRAGPQDRREGKLPFLDAGRLALLYVHGAYPQHPDRTSFRPREGRAATCSIEEPFVPRYFFPSLSERRPLAALPERQPDRGRSGGRRESERARSREARPRGDPDRRAFSTPTGTRQGPYSLEGAVFAGAGRILGPARATDVRARRRCRRESLAGRIVRRLLRGDESLNLEELPFDAEAGRVTGPARELTSGNNRVGFFDASPPTGRRSSSPRSVATGRTSGASTRRPPGRAHARSGALGYVSRLVARRRRDRVFTRGRRGPEKDPGSLDHEGRRHPAPAGRRLHRTVGLAAGWKGSRPARRHPPADRSRHRRRRCRWRARRPGRF